MTIIAGACGSAVDTSGALTVQISKFVINPGTVTCVAGTFNGAAPDTVLLQVEMVNTTGEDATVSSTGADGVVIRTSTGDFVGTTAIAFSALPFNPQPSLIVAHTGDLTVRIALPTALLCATSKLPANGFKDVQVVVRVSTNSGQYTSPPATLHFFFQPLL